MFYKLAVKNVTKSMKDYTVYFLTLMFGVCLFYMFNSIDSQTAMLQLSSSQKQVLQTLTQIIGYVSVFISVVLGFLIVYANRFLMKRRKKELGVYMTLGMPKGSISIIIIVETLLIGLISLAVGLLLGIFLSQGMSILTAKLFEVNLSKFIFTFSSEALWKTLVYFGVIFLVVMLFNTVSVSKLNLIDLLSAAHKNEKLHIRRLWVSVVIFIVSVVCLGTAYYLVETYGILQISPQFISCLILGIVGTLLFFLSLSGFLLRVTQSNKKLYFKGLNMFVLRQFNSKINSTFVSVSVICIMLLITIGTISTGLSLTRIINRNLDVATPFDASLTYVSEGYSQIFFGDEAESTKHETAKEENLDITANLKAAGFDLDKWAKSYGQIYIYVRKDIPYDALISESSLPQRLADYYANNMKGVSMTAMSLSDFNKILKLKGKKELVLKENEYAVNCPREDLLPCYQSIVSSGKKLTINGTELSPLSTLISEMDSDEGFFMEWGTLILPDSYLKGMKPIQTILNIQFKPETDSHKFKETISRFEGADKCYTGVLLKSEIYDFYTGSKTTATYITLYIGLVFLIAAAAVLALQQLSEASDNAERYGLLRKLGTEEKMINRALFHQIALYFLLPLSLAIVHSAVGIHVVNQAMMDVNNTDILGSLVGTACILVIVYGAYFLATYFASRSMIRQKDIARRVD
jgi:putative ABC transport system permease protein